MRLMSPIRYCSSRQSDLVLNARRQKQMRRAHQKIRADGFAFCDLSSHAMQPILKALGVDRGSAQDVRSLSVLLLPRRAPDGT